MAIDLQQWQHQSRESADVFRLGWVGAPNNLAHLERLDPILHEVTRRFPQVRLMVFSGRKPDLKCPFEFTSFSPNGEIPFIQQLDAGLLPLTNEEYSRGKSPIKAIQYLACGVPVVGNVYGATSEICNPLNSIAVDSPEQWIEAIARLVRDRAFAQEMGQTGRLHIANHHCSQSVGLAYMISFQKDIKDKGPKGHKGKRTNKIPCPLYVLFSISLTIPEYGTGVYGAIDATDSSLGFCRILPVLLAMLGEVLHQGSDDDSPLALRYPQSNLCQDLHHS